MVPRHGTNATWNRLRTLAWAVTTDRDAAPPHRPHRRHRCATRTVGAAERCCDGHGDDDGNGRPGRPPQLPFPLCHVGERGRPRTAAMAGNGREPMRRTAASTEWREQHASAQHASAQHASAQHASAQHASANYAAHSHRTLLLSFLLYGLLEEKTSPSCHNYLLSVGSAFRSGERCTHKNTTIPIWQDRDGRGRGHLHVAATARHTWRVKQP